MSLILVVDDEATVRMLLRRWIEKAGQRRRRYYRLTASGKNVLLKQRAGWREFVEAINLITGIQHA